MGLRAWLRQQLERHSYAVGAVMAEECEAFLAGEYVRVLARTDAGGAVPPWVWLNPIAHRRPTALRHYLGEVGGAVHRQTLTWRECQAIITAELFDLAGGDEEVVRELQREALQPLECLLAGEDVTPDGLASLAVRAMWASPAHSPWR